MQGLYATSAILDSSIYSDNMPPDVRVPLRQAPRPPRSRRDIPTPSAQEKILINALGPSISNTSFVSRMESSLPPGHPIPSTLINQALGAELAGNVVDCDFSVIDLIFPNDRLPFKIDDDLLKKMSTSHDSFPALWDKKQNRFCSVPREFTEDAISDWLNTLGGVMGKIFNRKVERVWWSGNRDTPPVGAHLQRKPDLVLLDRKYHGRLTAPPFGNTDWAFIRAFGEVTSGTQLRRVTESINVKSYLMFLCQCNRRFVIALSFVDVKKAKFALTLSDREGQIQLGTISLSSPGTRNGIAILKVLAFLMFGSPSDIGLDPHFEMGPDGRAAAITVDNRRFDVVDRIHALESLLGRGTQVWVVKENGSQFILKDSWVLVERVESEVNFLQMMTSHGELKDRVPLFVCGGDIQIAGVQDCTNRCRGDQIGRPDCNRVHRRIVMSPVGENILSFRSKQEFIDVIMSIIRSMLNWLSLVFVLIVDP